MTQTGSSKRVIFDPDSVEISDISTGRPIAKGVTNHASKAYEFSHFLPYTNLVQSQLLFEREGKTILPKPFSYDTVSINVSDSESEAEDKVESLHGIKDEVHSDLDPDRVPNPNRRHKWAQKVIEAAGNMTGESSDMRRKRSHFKK